MDQSGQAQRALCRGAWLTEVAWVTGENQLVLWACSLGTCPPAGGRREMEEENQIPDPEKEKQAAQFGKDGGRIGDLWDSQGLDPSSI